MYSNALVWNAANVLRNKNGELRRLTHKQSQKEQKKLKRRNVYSYEFYPALAAALRGDQTLAFLNNLFCWFGQMVKSTRDGKLVVREESGKTRTFALNGLQVGTWVAVRDVYAHNADLGKYWFGMTFDELPEQIQDARCRFSCCGESMPAGRGSSRSAFGFYCGYDCRPSFGVDIAPTKAE